MRCDERRRMFLFVLNSIIKPEAPVGTRLAPAVSMLRAGRPSYLGIVSTTVGSMCTGRCMIREVHPNAVTTFNCITIMNQHEQARTDDNIVP